MRARAHSRRASALNTTPPRERSLLRRCLLDGVVDRTGGEVRVDETEIVLRPGRRDVSDLAEIPGAEDAGPGPVATGALQGFDRPIGLLFLGHPLPAQLFGRQL